MRVLVASTPTLGHVHPMVPLARAFLDVGDEVRWATAAETCAHLAAAGFDAVPAGLPAGAGQDRVRPIFLDPDLSPPQRRTAAFSTLFGHVRAGPMLADLVPIVDAWRPDVIVHEMGELASPVAAAAAGVPAVTQSFGSLVPEAAVAAAAEAVAPLWEAHGLSPRPYAGAYDGLYFDIFPPALGDGDAPYIPLRRPLRPVPFAVDGGSLPPLSDPFLYVTFGTVFNTDSPVLRTVVEAVRDLTVDVLVTVGPEGDVDALGPQPANVRVERYVSQLDVLPRAAAVVSHGGSGTFLAALTHGVPQVCIPQGADQFENAAACGRTGAGVAVTPADVSAETVRTAAAAVLSDPAYRAAAGRLRDEIAAMPGPDAAVEEIRTRVG